jgi:hypothetical protein
MHEDDGDRRARPEMEPVEIGGGWRPRAAEQAGAGLPWYRRPMVLAVAAVAGLAIGYLAGTGRAHDQPAPAASPSPTAGPHLVTGGIALTGAQCSRYEGHTLQVGVEVTNLAGVPAMVTAVYADTPGGGLHPSATTWGACGELSPPPTLRPYLLPPDGTAWLSTTFQVTVPCPAATPVLFTLTVTISGNSRVDDIGGFNDLGGVPYPGCSATPS